MRHRFRSTRLVLTCILGVVGGAAALPAALSWASGAMTPATAHVVVNTAVRAPASGQAHAAQISAVRSHHAAGDPGGMGPASFYGTTPALIVNIYAMPCFSYVTTSAVEARDVATVDPRTDPRFKPCGATVDDFKVQWSSRPTAAQTKALLQVMGNLALQHPTISLQDATPLIRAAVLAAS